MIPAVTPVPSKNLDGTEMGCNAARAFRAKKTRRRLWFFIPNDTPYTFVTDPDVEALENYYYQYNGSSGLPMRFSLLRPMAMKE